MTEAKVGIGSVWDTAVEAVRGRLALILPIAASAIFLPSVVQAGLALYAGGAAGNAVVAPATGSALLRFALMLGLLVLTLWGALAITAITSAPGTTAPSARGQASARLPALLGVTLVLTLALTLPTLPVIAVLAAAGVDMTTMGQPGGVSNLGRGSGLFILLYSLFLLGVLLWLFARLMPLLPTVLHERLGLRAIGRAFRLTRGLGFKLVGVLVLYAIVLTVATSAAEWVTFIPFRLILGAGNSGVARFIGAVVGALVATALSVLAYAFAAQLYRRLTAHEHGTPIGDAHPAR
ncbi:MAG TPA: hypothetical protein VF592_00745 [Sphingomonas sp.]|uniref:hypothetical protein n=1 Tax=Sphingomonas sp. TaxID=28214 RepID=UPI002ED7A9A2